MDHDITVKRTYSHPDLPLSITNDDGRFYIQLEDDCPLGVEALNILKAMIEQAVREDNQDV